MKAELKSKLSSLTFNLHNDNDNDLKGELKSKLSSLTFNIVELCAHSKLNKELTTVETMLL